MSVRMLVRTSAFTAALLGFTGLCARAASPANAGKNLSSKDVRSTLKSEPAIAVAPSAAVAGNTGYIFTKIAALGDTSPCGAFMNDFEPYAINGSGEVAFATDLPGGVEGAFVTRNSQIQAVACGNSPAPGGGVFIGDLGRMSLNDGGDVVFGFLLDSAPGPPSPFPSGAYQYLRNANTTSVLLQPGTPAPGSPGSQFLATWFNTGLNNRGEAVFAGLVDGEARTGLYVAEKDQITPVVTPGTPAPGGGTFDNAWNGWVNDAGDIAFGGHIAGETCIDLGLACGESVYVRTAATGGIRSIAHQGDAAPGGGSFAIAFGPVMNNRGDIVFIGDLTVNPDPTNLGHSSGVFLYSKGVTVAVAHPGDPMPGGGSFLTAGPGDSAYGLNEGGVASFSAVLSTTHTVGTDTFYDTGVFASSNGSGATLVARTGTSTPFGEIVHLGSYDALAADPPTLPFNAGGIANSRGQILFSATMTDGNTYLLVATPKGNAK